MTYPWRYLYPPTPPSLSAGFRSGPVGGVRGGGAGADVGPPPRRRLFDGADSGVARFRLLSVRATGLVRGLGFRV